MANPKEKTPMCLVNELARFNKIQPEYKLLCEQGPAHSKVTQTGCNTADVIHLMSSMSLPLAYHAMETVSPLLNSLSPSLSLAIVLSLSRSLRSFQ